MTLSSEAMNNFEALQLTSTQTGFFTKFLTKWNNAVEHLKANKLAMVINDAYIANTSMRMKVYESALGSYLDHNQKCF